MRSKVPLTVVAATMLLFAACSSSPTATPTGAAASASPAPSASAATAGCTQGATGSQTVTIQNFAFSPTSLSVATGTTVTWTNKDGTTHTVTADDGSFDCGNVSGGQSVSLTFTKAGTYDYHCAIHPTMKATVTVT